MGPSKKNRKHVLFDDGSSQVIASNDDDKTTKQLREEDKRRALIAQLSCKERSLSKEAKEELGKQQEALSEALKNPLQQVLLSRPDEVHGLRITHVLAYIDGPNNNLMRLLQPLQNPDSQFYHENVLFIFVMHMRDTADFFLELDNVHLRGRPNRVLTPVGWFSLSLALSSRTGVKTNCPAKRCLEVRVFQCTLQPQHGAPPAAATTPVFTFDCNAFGATDTIEVPVLTSTVAVRTLLLLQSVFFSCLS